MYKELCQKMVAFIRVIILRLTSPNPWVCGNPAAGQGQGQPSTVSLPGSMPLILIIFLFIFWQLQKLILHRQTKLFCDLLQCAFKTRLTNKGQRWKNVRNYWKRWVITSGWVHNCQDADSKGFLPLFFENMAWQDVGNFNNFTMV